MTDLVMVVAAPDKEVMVALGLLPQDAGVMASVKTWLIPKVIKL